MQEQHRQAESRKDRRFALLACLYANSHRDPDKRSTPFAIEDFLPSVPRGTSPETAYNGSSNPGADLRASIAKLAVVAHVKALNPDDPRLKLDREEIERFNSREAPANG